MGAGPPGSWNFLRGSPDRVGTPPTQPGRSASSESPSALCKDTACHLCPAFGQPACSHHCARGPRGSPGSPLRPLTQLSCWGRCTLSLGSRGTRWVRVAERHAVPLVPTRGLPSCLGGGAHSHPLPSALSSFCKLGSGPSFQRGVPPAPLAALPADQLIRGSVHTHLGPPQPQRPPKSHRHFPVSLWQREGRPPFTFLRLDALTPNWGRC